MSFEKELNSRVTGKAVQHLREVNQEGLSRVISKNKRESAPSLQPDVDIKTPEGDPPELAVGTKLKQRDRPEVDWQIRRLNGEHALLVDLRTGATVNKRRLVLREQLSTPGSAWEVRY